MTASPHQESSAVARSLDPLLRKAAIDAGFDLEPEREGDWWHLGTSGAPGDVWIAAFASGIRLAGPTSTQFEELDLAGTQGPAPLGLSLSAQISSPASLHTTLKRLRVLLGQSPVQLNERLLARLATLDATERTAVIRQRIGQALFREALMEYWDGRCAITGIDVPELLRASHAKPWKDATDAERLDVHNGLLLAVHLDALFDQGLLAFDDQGQGILSQRIEPSVRKVIGLGDNPPCLKVVREAHRPYLDFHRRNVFTDRG